MPRRAPSHQYVRNGGTLHTWEAKSVKTSTALPASRWNLCRALGAGNELTRRRVEISGVDQGGERDHCAFHPGVNCLGGSGELGGTSGP
jgi:hypothetical protein